MALQNAWPEVQRSKLKVQKKSQCSISKPNIAPRELGALKGKGAARALWSRTLGACFELCILSLKRPTLHTVPTLNHTRSTCTRASLKHAPPPTSLTCCEHSAVD